MKVRIGLHTNEPFTSHRREEIFAIVEAMRSKTAPGVEFTGWLDYPSRTMEEDVAEIEAYADRIQAERIFVLGIGGSYLGAYAAACALDADGLYFTGNSFSAADLSDALNRYDPARDHVVVISKSGSTMETAIAFRLFLERAGGESEHLRHFTIITDAQKGPLRDFAIENGIRRFVVPEDMGGRYSVLSPVGLVPMALGGIDIREVLRGARDMEAECAKDPAENKAAEYALFRDAMRRDGKVGEIFAVYEPKLMALGKWWQQLFGESEGKDGRGMIPVPLVYSADLHSMGQWIQQGPKTFFETVLFIEDGDASLAVPDLDMKDGLNGIANKAISEVNRAAFTGTRAAHEAGGVDTASLVCEKMDAYQLGRFFYFMEYACALSAYLDGVNPFDQPGVEDYKQAMRERL
ncbi:Glucose-6-phosphate isomerase [Aedoeadaptatus ivorii]|uniref:Glucose-6-phosphate isomerase n=1 Tax=Aedoeadaptatus ivorii TaxID=54006 RepID=A0A3S5BWD0_9FIRM|nr:glucose-6-phosphate isomerase [Peptoniphilus ivorii]MDQ0508137.1 glucose-6-phosphate isomerase [Peptoniphilus ivorii]VEJ35868.1 Glucose-6-phosphate isomerase [Peptoniphilus ivorii]